MRKIRIVNLDGTIRFDDLKLYPGMSDRDMFMLYVIGSALDYTTTRRIELLVNGEVTETQTL